MAYVRPIRVTGATGGTTGDIAGVVSASWAVAMNFAWGRSDADIGPTSADLRGFSVTGTLTLDDDSFAATLSNQVVESLAIEYKTAGGTDKTRTFNAVLFGGIGPISAESAAADGPTGRYQVKFTGVIGVNDGVPSDFMAVA